MRIEHEDEEKLKKIICDILSRYIDLSEYDVFFFGSRVEGKGDERSDIDIGIEGEKPLPAHILGKIREEIDKIPILYTVDFVDFGKLSESIRRTAKKDYIVKRKK